MKPLAEHRIDKIAECTMREHLGINSLRVLSLGWYKNQNKFFTNITDAFWYYS